MPGAKADRDNGSVPQPDAHPRVDGGSAGLHARGLLECWKMRSPLLDVSFTRLFWQWRIHSQRDYHHPGGLKCGRGSTPPCFQGTVLLFPPGIAHLNSKVKAGYTQALVQAQESRDSRCPRGCKMRGGRRNSLVFLNTPSSLRPINGALRVRRPKLVACRRRFQASEMLAPIHRALHLRSLGVYGAGSVARARIA
ncbi:hypothetical protein L226DRAFT_241029 [Lentinus tigrinus ALCF2SS1-7]|uniref:uncharacterized protein n=1 Tax=Lentinus tigrinus ALCF2SS1-7 TaxID=1328758 RepID=UPI0011663B3F|nr:hypothetical protein L226DRAFT_241029 [Lentinus tigrinus ALCF2SS1-7]